MLVNEQLAEMINKADTIIESENGVKEYEKLVYEEVHKLSTQSDNFENKELKRIGASEIGSECERKLYYSYHKFPKKRSSSRLLRLFNRGKLEEARIIAYLTLMGLDVHATDENNNQFYFKEWDGAFSGHCDGIIKLSEEEYILLEMKTMNTKSFTELTSKGVQRSHPHYYSQVQVYMGAFNLQQSLFVTVCKETDDIYFQLVSYDEQEYKAMRSKAYNIITAYNIDALKRLSSIPSYYKCKWCEYHSICYATK